MMVCKIKMKEKEEKEHRGRECLYAPLYSQIAQNCRRKIGTYYTKKYEKIN